MKTIFYFVFFLIVIMCIMTGCAPKLDVSKVAPQEPFGFWSGLWHGMIAPITFFISLFSDSIAMYAKNNTGGWYDFGFCVGAGILFGTAGVSKKD